MSTKFLYFTGPCKWAKLKTPDEYNGVKKWKINVYLNKNELKQLKDSGLRLKVKEDEDGSFVTFNRDVEKDFGGEVKSFEPPQILDSSNEPIDVLVGNGSTVTAKVAVFDSAMGKAHRLEKVRIDNLVEFVQEEEGEF